MSLSNELKRLRNSIDLDYPADGVLATSRELRSYLLNVANYIEQHQSTSYYPISRLFEASECKTASEVLKVTNYLTSDDIGFLIITFCYYPYDSDDVVEISPECYRGAKFKGEEPVDSRTGEEIDDFDPLRLGFFCYVKEFS
jgi:hypothetical protein